MPISEHSTCFSQPQILRNTSEESLTSLIASGIALQSSPPTMISFLEHGTSNPSLADILGEALDILDDGSLLLDEKNPAIFNGPGRAKQ